jgi:hypothetical protein
MRAKPAISGLVAPRVRAAESLFSWLLLRCAPHGLRAGALGLALAGAPMVCTAQTFIRVTPPSTSQQDQGTVNAMPNTNVGAQVGAAGPGGGSQEAILSDTGSVVKVVDASGKEVKKGALSLNGWRPTFSLNVGISYDNNIFIQRNKTGDFITSIQPGIVLGWGDYRAELPRLGQFAHEYEIPVDDLTAQRYLYITYDPTIQRFADHSSQDAVDENLFIAGSYQVSKVVVQGSFQYQTLSNADIDVGDRVDRTLYSGTLSGLFTVDTKTSVESDLVINSTEYDQFYQSSVDVSDSNYLDYQLAPKTNIAVGFDVGYLMPQLSANQFYQQLLGRVRWAASDKLYASLTAGVEFREANGGTSKVDAVFDGSLNYAPFDGTRFLFAAKRAANPASDELGQDIVITSVTFGVQQRLFGRVYASASAVYGNADYQQFSSGSGINRSDDTVGLVFNVGADVSKYAGIQLATRFLEDNSNLKDRSFDEDVVTLQCDLTY